MGMHRKHCPYCVRYYGYPDTSEVSSRVAYHKTDECPVYNQYLDNFIAQTIEHRRKTYEHMIRVGFGVGTMIRTSYTIGVSLWWVLDIEWDLIYPARFNGGDYYNYLNSLINSPIRCSTICNNNTSNFATPYSLEIYKMPKQAYHFYEIVSTSGMPALPPLDFYSSASCYNTVEHYLRTM